MKSRRIYQNSSSEDYRRNMIQSVSRDRACCISARRSRGAALWAAFQIPLMIVGTCLSGVLLFVGALA